MFYDKIAFKIFSWLLNIKTAFAQEVGDTGSADSLPNPFGEGSTITSALNSMLSKILLIAAPIVTIMILYGAFLMLTSAGDPKKFEDGKKTIIYAIVGFFVILLASSIPYIVKDLLGAGTTANCPGSPGCPEYDATRDY